jgi:hypothetical protein
MVTLPPAVKAVFAVEGTANAIYESVKIPFAWKVTANVPAVETIVDPKSTMQMIGEVAGVPVSL